ncbi:MAG: squalene--hopene cyclase [Planctomycetota bacterium]|nr:MAG: squalene--hopene cyclase [Planctomycetota bacterium]
MSQSDFMASDLADPPLPAPTGASALGGLAAMRAARTSAKPKAGAGAAKPLRSSGDDLPPLAGPVDYLDAAPAWLISATVHLLVLIILGLSLVGTDGVGEFVLSLSLQDSGGEDFQDGDVDVPINLDEPPLAPGDALESAAVAVVDSSEMMADAPPAVAALGLEAVSDAPSIQFSLTGRSEGMKESLLRAYGGTSSTETAVTEALRWLARNQGSNGLWSLAGKYSDGAYSDNPDAATAMALLAFQGAGITPHSDRKSPFSPAVTRGWNALLKRQEPSGEFFHEGSPSGRLYTQALATIALCELYAMTKESRYREPAQAAVNYCIKAQAPEGGWRYQPGFDSDLSVTGWFVMALQSARMAGLEVDQQALERISGFLDAVAQDAGAQYSYLPGQAKKLSMTAEGLLCRQYLGWQCNDKRLQRGVEVLLRNLPNPEENQSHAYYWYYAAQVCHHMEGSAWRSWNQAMREVVPALQVREGKERGSWDPNIDQTDGVRGGGRLFVTCLATYMLEVYYRHLPIYQLDALKGGM